MSNEVLVKVENVSKKFCRDLKKSLWYGVSDIACEFTGLNNKRDLRPKEFWALNDISFELKRGEVLGLIGKNGAGKTTLLRVLNNLIKPDTGRITMRGRVGALIALGAGFNPILTGRENVYVNAAVLGINKKEIDAKFDEIVDSAELWDFIDSPVQSYSSGMQVRLGFAVATALKPDILLLDEVLAVGDVEFRTKCYHRIGEILSTSSVIFVTHAMDQIGRLCNTIMLLDDGKIKYYGDVNIGVNKYMSSCNVIDDYAVDENNYKIFDKRIKNFKINLVPNLIQTGEAVNVDIKLLSTDDIDVGLVVCNFTNDTRLLVAAYDSNSRGHNYSIKKGENHFSIDLGNLPLSGGDYIFNIAMFDDSKKVSLIHAYENLILKIKGRFITTSIIEMGG